MIELKKYAEIEWPGVWRIIESVLRAGENYAYSPTISEQTAKELWINAPTAVYVANDKAGNILGIYYIEPN